MGETDVFLDLGSGMGRMLQQAATYPFARVIGVEVSEELNRIARMNFEQNKGRFTCEEVEFVTCDAAEFQISDDITHVYLNNSFAGETFTRVIENLIASLDRVPRRMVFMYCHPRLSQVIDATGRFELVSSKRGVEIYESVTGSR